MINNNSGIYKTTGKHKLFARIKFIENKLILMYIYIYYLYKMCVLCEQKFCDIAFVPFITRFPRLSL